MQFLCYINLVTLCFTCIDKAAMVIQVNLIVAIAVMIA